jgi:MFS family permease
MNLGACASAIAAGSFSSHFGRRAALWLACLVCYIAVALQIGSTSKVGLYIGRLLLGFSNGFLVVFSTVYCSEAAPAHLREYVSPSPFHTIKAKREMCNVGFGVWKCRLQQ